MPIYEYQCEKCGEVFEVTQKISDPPLKKHDSCGSKKVKKLISQTSFQLKGGGWYVTDYANKKTETKTEKKTETKSDSPKSEDKKPSGNSDKAA